jgi:E3 ubiquitin-protein ligase MGRN1
MLTTQTIRNDLNLYKPSLRVHPDPSDPGRYYVSFTFDATVPATATVFFLARETERDTLTTER